MAGYRLSKRADEDFESIYVYGALTFGLEQTEAYTSGMQARFEQLADQPLLYPAIDHVRPGYRLSVYGSHAIYYRMDNEGVFIVRILRSQDVATAMVEDHGR
ncbi:MAG: type II toxin-antitoxin system RelE/ParE family toxin [Porticoccaceae bacterium]|nr:type II toxin-antitoxin system RelE/ParE family toxin [Porticoccaceae bacterium]